MKRSAEMPVAVFALLIFVLVPSLILPQKSHDLDDIKANFINPPMNCRPHTYWWWPGNAVTKEEITWELQQMHDKGIGGVLITSAATAVYEKGNIPYLSDTYLAMLHHAILTAKRLGMEVNINFAKDWVFGGEWVPFEDRSQSLVPVSLDLNGPTLYNSELLKFTHAADRRGEIKIENIPNENKLVAVIAGRVDGNRIVEPSLLDLTEKVNNGILTWQVPQGTWRLMVFWLKYTGQEGSYVDNISKTAMVDHFSKSAMSRYCNFLGGTFQKTFGDEFGKTVEAFHSDSFELANLPNGIYWSDSLMIKFHEKKGYDLAKYLPAIWWNVGDISERVRYDVNDFLHEICLDTYFKTFLDWCESHGVKGSMEPYGITTDILQGAGMAHLPFNEITPGEKDGVPWFDNRIGPKKYVTSGAHIYGRNVVGVEAYTFIHWELYRATLEELKIASDGFLRSGANKFYNHGYSYSPERDVAPSRSIPFAARISHPNIWWKYYPQLADYISRCSYLLRQGEFEPDIAIYSPLANQWTLNVLNARKWTREFYWGELGSLLIANGYDFDLLNDDALQNMARIEDGKIKIRSMEYKILILPNIKALPLETLQFIQEYVQKGGVVIALERVPDSSVGLADYALKDEKVKTIVADMFHQPRNSDDTAARDYGAGRTYHQHLVINRQDVLDWRSSILDPFVNTLRDHCQPDFGIDFAQLGLRKNNGLSFLHRKLKDMDIYFVSNIQDKKINWPILFRVKNKIPSKWNPYNSEISNVYFYNEKKNGLEIPVRLLPYESTFFVFKNGIKKNHIDLSSFYDITRVNDNEIEALAAANGIHQIKKNNILKTVPVSGVPAPFTIDGTWRLVLQGKDFARIDTTTTQLFSWTKELRMKHFSGTGRYEIFFEIPEEYIEKDIQLLLDLGKIGNVAEVELNGINLGTIWMRGQTLDITKAARSGQNSMVVLVTNTLINRVAGFKDPPPVPEYLVPYYGSGKTPYSSYARGPIGFKPLPFSGLKGPVQIRALKRVNIHFD